ncbi:MAG: hypothetical protein ACTSRZ_01640 [Promethearchaeota archaeon]
MVFDYLFKRIIKDKLTKYQVKINEKIGELPLEIDLIVEQGKKSQESDLSIKGAEKSLSLGIITKRLLKYNLVEYKSSHDNPEDFNLSKVMGYLGLYANREQIGLQDLCSKFSAWYICSSYPKFMDNLKSNDYIEDTSDKGVYALKIKFPCPFYILIIEELEKNIENLPLLLNIDDDKLIEIIKFIKSNNLQDDAFYKKYLSLNYYIRNRGVKKLIKEIIPNEIKNNIKDAVEQIGVEKVIDAVGVEKVIDAVGVEKVIDAVGVEKVIDAVGVEKVIKLIGIKQLIKKIGENEILENIGRKRIKEYLESAL